MAVGIFVAVLVFGIVSLLALGVDLLPHIQIPAVVVKTTYPGATPSVMDLQVTQVIENVVSSISGITDINSRSSLGLGLSVFTFDPSTDKYADANQVATAVSASIRNLPQNVTAPSIQTFDPNSAPVLQFGLSGQGANLADVSDYVQNILGPSIERVDGVATVLADGAPTKQFTVLLDPDKLRYYNLRAQDVVNAIAGLRPQHAHRDDRQEQERPDIPDAEPAGRPAPDQPHSRGFHPGNLRGPGRTCLVESRRHGLRARERQAGGAPLRPAHHGFKRRRGGRQGEAAAAEHHAARRVGDSLQQ